MAAHGSVQAFRTEVSIKEIGGAGHPWEFELRVAACLG